MIWVLNVAVVALVIYAAIAALIGLAQTAMLFPAKMVPEIGGPLPVGARRLIYEASDGVKLHGIYTPAASQSAKSKPLLLGFGGNAWNAGSLAHLMAEVLPDHDTAVFYYRGYAPSEDKPSAKAILRDAVFVHDRLITELGPRPLIAMGFSIGSAVAMHLARERMLAGIVLVTPFDSLHLLARHHYWWLPIRLLLRHRMDVASDATKIDAPVAVVAAENDRVVPPARTDALRRAISRVVFDRTLPMRGHNDLYDDSNFPEVLRTAVKTLESVASRSSPD